jgi:hypothetical protein
MMLSLVVISIAQLGLLLYIRQAHRRTRPGTGRVTAARIRRRAFDGTGQSLVEAALALPVVLGVTFVIIDFSWLLFSFLALQNGVGEAARYGITGSAMPGLTRAESIRSVMRSTTPTLQIRDQDVRFSHLVGTNWIDGVGGPGEVERLSATYDHEVLVFRPLFPGGRITLQAESAMKNESRFP